MSSPTEHFLLPSFQRDILLNFPSSGNFPKWLADDAVHRLALQAVDDSVPLCVPGPDPLLCAPHHPCLMAALLLNGSRAGSGEQKPFPESPSPGDCQAAYPPQLIRACSLSSTLVLRVVCSHSDNGLG